MIYTELLKNKPEGIHWVAVSNSAHIAIYPRQEQGESSSLNGEYWATRSDGSGYIGFDQQRDYKSIDWEDRLKYEDWRWVQEHRFEVFMDKNKKGRGFPCSIHTQVHNIQFNIEPTGKLIFEKPDYFTEGEKQEAVSEYLDFLKTEKETAEKRIIEIDERLNLLK